MTDLPFFRRRGGALALTLALAVGAAGCASPSLTQPDLHVVALEDGRTLVFEVPPPPPEAALYRDFMLGWMASQSNAPDEAAQRYARVLEARPDDGNLAERAVFAALISGDYAGALAMSQKAGPQPQAEVPLVRMVLGTQALIAGDVEAARAHMGGDGLGAFNRLMAHGALAWFDLPDGEAARRRLGGALVGDPLYDGVNVYQAGLIAVALGEEARALDVFEALWLGGMRLAFGAEAHAGLLASQGRIGEAMALIDTFRAEVGHAPSLEKLAEQIRSGAPVIREPLTPRQGAALAFFGPAAAMAAQTEDDLAGVYFTLALALDPELHVARNLWGDALDRAGRFDAAMAVLGAVPPSSEYYANARAQLAWVLRRAGRSEEALATAREALERTPDRNLTIQLGDLLNSLGEEAASEAVFSQVIAEDAAQGRAPDWRILHARGTVRDRLGDWEGAKADLRRALAVNPDEAETLNYLGYSLVDRGESLSEAFDMIRRAIALEPEAGHIVDSLGWGYYRLGQFERAVEELERAASLLPGDPTIADHLGDAYWQAGRRLEAQFQWRRALALEPEEALRVSLEGKLAGTLTPGQAGAAQVR